jgi:hypothetical protein
MATALQSEHEKTVGGLVADPWPHLIVDNFLPSSVYEQSLSEIGAESYSYEIEPRGTGRIEFSLLRSEALWRAIYSKSTVALLSAAFGVAVKLNKHNMVQLRRMNEDTPEFPLHNDFTSGEDTIASFLYLSSGWSTERGGRLNLFASSTQSTPFTSIAPIPNRFIAFRTEASHWHSVESVHGWERLSVLSLWNIEPSHSG